MPNQPNPDRRHRMVRVPEAEWTDLDTAAKAQATNRARLINEFISWYLRRPGAKLPKRPPTTTDSAEDDPR
jgi:hypothetical protein